MPSIAGMFELHRADLRLGRLGAEREGPLVGVLRVDDAERHGRRGGAVLGREPRREGSGLGVEDEVDVALAVEGDVLGAVPRHRREAHLLEQPVELLRVGMAELDELEAVGAHRVLVRDGGRRGIVRERSHGFLLSCSGPSGPASM